MQTTLAPEYKNTPEGLEAEGILRKCVHCGFCTATCPTYQLLGDELDGPRGRIYLIKQVLEGHAPTRKTQQHLDRCLTCRNCESTCPSGVQYGHLVDIGRQLVDQKVARPFAERAKRWALKEGLSSPLFAPALALGQSLRAVLPTAIKNKIPEKRDGGIWPMREHARKVLMLEGCVQPSMAGNINTSTARVLDALQLQVIREPLSGCCGAVKFHLNDQAGGLAQMRRNIDAWWTYVEHGAVEAIVMNASGCGVMVKDYAHHLAQDAQYAEKAKKISALGRDLSEFLPQFVGTLKPLLGTATRPVLKYHPPCTLQHGQKLRGGVENLFADLGFELSVASQDAHLCCGSAGTYSILQPALSNELRDRKLSTLEHTKAEIIVSANIGCITHLQTGTATPVRHWIEVLDAALQFKAHL